MKVLFLCTGNSARSQMAEGLLRARAPRDWQIYSAGTHPVGLNPNAVKAMSELGLDISGHRSKGLGDVPAAPDTVITVCDSAAEACPVYPGNVRRLHWSVEDPAAKRGSAEEILAAFRAARDDLKNRIDDFLKKR